MEDKFIWDNMIPHKKGVNTSSESGTEKPLTRGNTNDDVNYEIFVNAYGFKNNRNLKT